MALIDIGFNLYLCKIFHHTTMSDEAQEIAKKQYGNKIRVRACGICIENQQVLMICHKGVINDKDVWLPPGGGVEDGESITDALMREFLEETGFEVKVGCFMFKHELIHAPIHSVELYFEVEILAGKLIVGKDPETTQEAQLIKDVRWIPLKNRDFFTDEVYLAINS